MQTVIFKSEIGYFHYLYLGREEQNEEVPQVSLSFPLVDEEITKNKKDSK